MKLTAIFILLLSFSMNAQKHNPQVVVNFTSDFFNTENKTLRLHVENATDGYLDYFISNLKKIDGISEFKHSKDNQSDYFLIEFQNPLKIHFIRQFFTELKLKEIYTPTLKKIYIEDLLTKQEIEDKKYTLKYYQVTEKSGDPDIIDYYNFNIYNIEAKIQSLYFNNYIKNLFNGNVAMMKDKLRNALEERNKFIQRQK